MCKPESDTEFFLKVCFGLGIIVVLTSICIAIKVGV